MAVPARRLDELPRRRPASKRTRRPVTGARRAPARQPARRRRRKARLPFLLLALIVTGAMVLLLVSAQAFLAQGAFRLGELERREQELEQEQAALRLQLAELSSPERISRAAREAGLVLPERIEILAVPGERAPHASASEPSGTLAIEPVPGGEG